MQNHCIRRLPGSDEKLPAGQEENVQTIAGWPRKAGMRDGRGRDARFNEPGGICCGKDGKMYVVDRENHCIRTISSQGNVKIVCGPTTGESGFREGDAPQALFKRPFGITASPSDGALFVTDSGNDAIRRLNPNTYSVDTPFDGTLSSPVGCAVDGLNCLYVSEWGAHQIRRIQPDGSSIVCLGSPQRGKLDGRGQHAQLFSPAGLAWDARGNQLFIADFGNHCIRRMTAAGDCSTVGMGGVVLVDDCIESQHYRLVSSSLGCQDGPARRASFNSPQDVAVDAAGDIYVADWGNHWVRKIEAE